MTLAPEDSEHPFLYARVLGIFHIHAYRAAQGLSSNDDATLQLPYVLWVLWFDIDTSVPGGFRRWRLRRLKWVYIWDDAFGFMSPD